MRRGRRSNASRAFFDFIREVPEFLRILNEAEFFAPIGYQKHLDNISTAYVRILQARASCRRDRRLQRRGIRGHRSHVDGRARLSQPPLFLFGGGVTAVPDHVISAYRKLMTRGLFSASGGQDTP